jgi:hypothetical protein
MRYGATWMMVAVVALAGCGGPTPAAPSRSAPPPAGWSATGGMLVARHGHTATRLRDGRVLVAGGSDAQSRPTTAAEIYDPSTGTWTATGSGGVFWEATATLLRDGRVLVVGGSGSTSQPTSAFELYDPSSGTWSAAGNMTTPRRAYTMTPLADGRVLVAGGLDPSTDKSLASAELFDPGTGTWSATGAMGVARASQAAALLADGRVLVAGGDGNGPLPNALASAELYDPATGTWSATASMSATRSRHPAVRLPDGTVLVVAGMAMLPGGQGTLKVETYDPSRATWRLGGVAGDSGIPRTAMALPGGQVLIVSTLGELDLYDARTETSTSVASPYQSTSGSTSGFAATLLADGRVLFTGGYELRSSNGFGLKSTVIDSAYVCDPGTVGR